MKSFLRTLPVLAALAALGLIVAASCAGPAKPAPKADAVSGATPQYSGGDRGALPPACEGYQVLGVKDGIKGWAVRYDARLLRGGEFHDDRAAAALKEWGVRTVVSITPNDREREFCRKNGLALVEVPFDKTKGPSSADLQRFLEAVRTGTGPFYAHCVGGTHRGGVLGVAYRVHVLGWPYEKALVEFGRLGGDLRADHALLEAVRNYKP